MVAESPSNDRRAMASAWPTMVAEELLSYRVKIKMLQLFMGNLCNALIIKWYVVVVKKAQSGMPSA